MHKILALSAVAAVFAGNALAQCSNYSNAPAGTLILQADDAIRTVGLPFAFPFNGSVYNAIVVSTNGWLKLGTTTNTANDLGESETLFLNNPITANNTNPRIAVCWDDLRPSGAGQGVYYASDPTQVTISWVNAPAFSQATAFANCECILTLAGDIYLKYDSTCNYSTNVQTGCTPIVGISKSDGTVAVATHTFDWTLATPGPLSVIDATGYQQFTNSAGLTPWDLTNVIIHFTPTGVSTYDVTNTTLPTCVPATYPILATASTSVGTACSYPSGNGSIYELFTVATGTNPIDISGTSYTYVRSGNQYTMVPGPGIDLTYTGTGTPQAGMADDTAHTRTLAMGSFQFGSQSITQVTIISNGYINMGNSTTNTLSSSVSGFHNLTQGRIAGCWDDLVPNTTTTPVYVDDTASMFRATWHNVPFFGVAGSTITMQITLDQATGNITVSYGTVTAAVTSTPPLVGLTGISSTAGAADNLITGGVANIIGPRTFTAPSFSAMSHTTGLASLGLPFVMTTTRTPSNVGFGSWLVGFSNPNVPVDAIFGPGQAPGCNIYSDFAQDLDLLFSFTAGATSFSKSIPVPFNTALAGIIIFTQAAVFVPAANPLGVMTSNGRTQTVGL